MADALERDIRQFIERFGDPLKQDIERQQRQLADLTAQAGRFKAQQDLIRTRTLRNVGDVFRGRGITGGLARREAQEQANLATQPLAERLQGIGIAQREGQRTLGQLQARQNIVQQFADVEGGERLNLLERLGFGPPGGFRGGRQAGARQIGPRQLDPNRPVSIVKFSERLGDIGPAGVQLREGFGISEFTGKFPGTQTKFVGKDIDSLIKFAQDNPDKQIVLPGSLPLSPDQERRAREAGIFRTSIGVAKRLEQANTRFFSKAVPTAFAGLAGGIRGNVPPSDLAPPAPNRRAFGDITGDIRDPATGQLISRGTSLARDIGALSQDPLATGTAAEASDPVSFIENIFGIGKRG